MPRSVTHHVVNLETLSAKPVNDQQDLLISIVMPVQFTYRMIQMNVTVTQDVADAWTSNGAYLEMINAMRGLPSGFLQRWSAVLDSRVAIPTAAGSWIARFDQAAMPTEVIQARDGAAPTITFKATNQSAAAGAAGVVNASFTFLEYDIEQAQRFSLHWPQLVYNRG